MEHLKTIIGLSPELTLSELKINTGIDGLEHVLSGFLGINLIRPVSKTVRVKSRVLIGDQSNVVGTPP